MNSTGKVMTILPSFATTLVVVKLTSTSPTALIVKETGFTLAPVSGAAVMATPATAVSISIS